MILSRYCTHTLTDLTDNGVLIPEAILTACLARDAAEKAHRRRLAQQLLQAREQRRQARARDRRLAAHRWRRQKACARKLYSRAQEQGAQTALQWLGDERQWEQTVYRQAMQHACSALADHLASQLPTLDWAGVLENQLTALLATPGMVPPLRLRVPAEQEAALRESLAHFSLQIAALPDNETGCAWLENDVVRVRIPLADQLTSLTEQLAALLTGENDGRC